MGSFLVSIDDSSSFINYRPHGDGGVGNWTSTGWQPWYSDKGFNTAGGELGTGQSLHITGFPNASLDFTFYGTEVALYGNANCSYDVSVDGSLQSFQAASGPELFHMTALDEKTHNVTLVAHASDGALFSFDWADITRPLPGEDIPSSQVFAATDPTFFEYRGDWSQKTDPNGQIPSESHSAPYYQVQSSPASLSFAFQGSGVSVNGSRNWGGYTYDVTLDDATTSYNESTMWLIGDALLFYQDGLDPSATHTVNITPKVGDGLIFWLNSVTVHGGLNATSTNSSTSPSSTLQTSSTASGSASATSNPSTSQPNSAHSSDAGRIAGGVIGGLAGLAILTGALVFYFRRRRVPAPARDPPVPAVSPYPDVADVAITTARETAPPMMSEIRKLAVEGLAATRANNQPPSSSAYSASSAPPSSGIVTGATAAPAVSPTSPRLSQGPGSEAAVVDRLIQLIADRIERTRAPTASRSDFSAGSDSMPPEYPPPGYPGA
ncbi:hypothetical protein BD309DRAFT_991860 [Dichomitus squalens]|nr:hypothetical protein BD309DRAFT_991860 [Dichomitus squalens]